MPQLDAMFQNLAGGAVSKVSLFAMRVFLPLWAREKVYFSMVSGIVSGMWSTLLGKILLLGAVVSLGWVFLHSHRYFKDHIHAWHEQRRDAVQEQDTHLLMDLATMQTSGVMLHHSLSLKEAQPAEQAPQAQQAQAQQ